MSKYDPLREHLARLDDVVWAAKLEDVETILGSALPKSARHHRTWWANSGGSLVHQNAWIDAGWRVDRTDLPRNVVVFRRLRIGGTPLADAPVLGRGKRSVKSNSASGRLASAVAALRQPVTVSLRAEWTELGVFQQTPCSASVVPEGAGILRLAMLAGDAVRTVILPSLAVNESYAQLRKEYTAAKECGGAVPAGGVFASLDVNPLEPIACDIVKPGNAWLLTDGRGRKVRLDDEEECNLAAQLLNLQEIQAGRNSQLIEL